MTKIALYIMGSKGLFVLEKFISTFGPQNIEYIISNEDKNIQNDFFSKIKILSNKENIPFFIRSDNYSDIENSFTGFKFCIGWRWLIKNEKKLIILHDSLLPKYRGFAPLVNALINNEKKVGVTALYASQVYDEGPIIDQIELNITYPIKINNVIKEIKPLYFKLIKNIYEKIIKNNPLKVTVQNNEHATYSPWLDNQDYFIDWSWSNYKIKRFVNAVGFPYNSAKAYLQEQIVTITDVDTFKDVFVENRVRHIGKLIFFNKGIPIIVCGEGLIAVKEIKNNKNIKININLRSRLH